MRHYLDHAATTPLLPAVRAAMIPWLDSGNASSLYTEGRAAKDALDVAREQLSHALGSLFAEVIFTSGGTEAANLAIVGAALANTDPHRTRILLGAAEHHCVLHTQAILERLGYRVDPIPVDVEGRIHVDTLAAQLTEDVLLVSVMHANNELGTIQDISQIAATVHADGALLHVDAVQTFRAIPWTVTELGADLISISAHKIGGPKGVGALYVKAGTQLKPLVGGGGQERELRGGTESVAAIVGFGAAALEPIPDPAHIAAIRDEFEQHLIEAGAVPTVTYARRLAGHCHVRFEGIQAETLLIRLDREGISASSGAACSSGSIEPSHVLLACGYTPAEAKEGIRFTLGRNPDRQNTRNAASIIADIAHNLQR